MGYFVKSINVITRERIQGIFKRVFPGLKSNSYEEILGSLAFFSLEKRRLRGDLKEAYQITRALKRVDTVI